LGIGNPNVRFDIKGPVLNGPAIIDTKRVKPMREVKNRSAQKNRRVPKLKSSSQAGRTWLELLHAWANALGNSDRSAIFVQLG
jgi:hypothetical protein